MSSNAGNPSRSDDTLRIGVHLALTSFILSALVGCASTPSFGGVDSEVRGIVIDLSGRAVTDVAVTVHGETYHSNRDGVFLLPAIESLSFELQARHPRHLSYAGRVNRTSRAELIVIRLASADDVVAAIERALIAAELDTAGHWLERAAENQLEDPRLLYLEAILAFRRGEYDEASALLDDFGPPRPSAVGRLRAQIEERAN